MGLAAMLGSPTRAVAAEGDFYSGQDLRTDCELEDTASAGFCIGFIQGAADGHYWALDPDAPLVVCAPKGVTLGQDREIVLRLLRDRPETLHLPAAMLVLIALEEAFPCP